MTLEEAINLNHDIVTDEFKPLTKYERQAIRLGIEALKRIQSIRSGISLSTYVNLPGETKERHETREHEAKLEKE